jgi:hypothetical protein
MAFTKKITCETKKISWVRAFYLNEKDEEIANLLSPIAWLASKHYAIEEKSKKVANMYRHRPCLLSSTTVQASVQCNKNFTRSYENLSVPKLVKTAINTAITVKLLKSKVTSLNTCEKPKMTHETWSWEYKVKGQWDLLLWNMSQLG